MKTKPYVNDVNLNTLEDWLNWLETLHPKEIELGLDRIRCVLDKLSLAELPFRTIIVGGTNGKGSCVAMLDSIYRCAGYRVGAFTSPHLWRFNERIRFNGQEIFDEPLIELFRCIEDARGLTTLSYFEYSVVAALLHFVRNKAELALLEVGLGGRLDAVNTIDADASLVVSVELDHQDWLGKDRESIGREKAGIFRPGRPAVVADRNPPESLLIHAQQLGSSLRLIGRDFDSSGTRGTWNYKGWGLSKENLPIPSFGGQEQLDNMAGCLAIIESMDECLPVELPIIPRGLSAAQLAGRTDRHVREDVEWIFDVAHNPAAARVFADEVIQLPSPRYTWAILAIMRDKDLSGVVTPFIDVVDRWIVTSTDSERSVNAEILGGLMKTEGASNVCSLADVMAACKLVGRLAESGHRVLVFGSFYLVGPAMTALALYSASSQTGDQSARWTCT